MDLFSEITTTEYLFTFLVCLVISKAIFKWYRERNYPPGPIGLPILGYGVFLAKNGHLKLKELSRKYGDIFSFYIGSHLYICLNEQKLVKEALTNPNLLYRFTESFDFMLGRGGMGGMNGEEWQEQRRFAFYTMRNLGLGKGQWEKLIQESVTDFLEEVKGWKGQPSNFEKAVTFTLSSTNISLLLGRRLDQVKDAETIKILRDATREFMEYFSSVSVNTSLKWLRKFMEIFRLGGYHRFYPLLRKFENIFKHEVEERMKDPESFNKDDFIGCFFKELQKREKEDKEHTFTYENLMGNLMILFIAGNDSTLASLSWLLLFMAHHQDIQKKVHEEIDSVIGSDGVVSYDDRNKFPYTLAVIYEMLRWVAIAPVFPPRLATEDIEMNGYVVPKGALVITNMWGIMHDPRNFKNPEKFDPDRFLLKKGEKITQVDGFLPFSIGKRNCPGEGVAIMTTFLYFTSIMQKFNVKMPPGKTADFEPIFGGAMLTKPQKICFFER